MRTRINKRAATRNLRGGLRDKRLPLGRLALLLRRLDRHKSHRRALNRPANRFRIGGIVLVALDYALTYCVGISRTSWPSAPSSRAQ